MIYVLYILLSSSEEFPGIYRMIATLISLIIHKVEAIGQGLLGSCMIYRVSTVLNAECFSRAIEQNSILYYCTLGDGVGINEWILSRCQQAYIS
jgi:hypothetical protein